MSQIASTDIPPPHIVFTRDSLRYGARMSMALAVSVLVYGAVFGMLARQTGLSLTASLFMSGLVHAGSAQFMVLELWQAPLPVVPIVVTTFLVNLRHILFGVALRPWFGGLSAFQQYSSAFWMADENWAMAMKEFDAGNPDAAVMMGSGFILTVGWLGGTLIGHLLGAIIPNPAAWGLDFAFAAVFIAMLVGLWKGRSHLLPWGVAATVAVLTSILLPDAWYILTGGIAGCLVGGLRHAE